MRVAPRVILRVTNVSPFPEFERRDFNKMRKPSSPIIRQIPLSPRENEVLALIYKGFSNPEIARELQIEDKTVKFHATNIYKKMGVEGRFGLVRLKMKELNDIKDALEAKLKPKPIAPLVQSPYIPNEIVPLPKGNV